jgi:DNA-binding NtrC family response regulator
MTRERVAQRTSFTIRLVRLRNPCSIYGAHARPTAAFAPVRVCPWLMTKAYDRLVREQRDKQALSRLIGESASFRRAIASVTAAARSNAAILIAGETGTGKELVARAVHYLSDRAAEPFVAVNCGSLTDTLLEDELFGHERGAFTDARHRRSGLIAQAEHGTLFLDEIDTLTTRGQVALLRVLQDKVYRPLGGEREQQAEVRFVAATNAPLGDAVESGAFRADLYYRISVFTITLPPLRDRQDDILPLAAHFLAKHCPDDRAIPTLSPAAQTALVAFGWPGNVRELENAMIRAARLCESGVVEPEHLHLPSPASRTALPAEWSSTKLRMLKSEMVRSFEHEYLSRVMREADGNVTRGAKIAGKDRRDFGKLLKKHGLMGPSSRRSG